MTWMGRTFAQFEPLWPAERKLVDQMGTGVAVRISPGLPPEDAPKEQRIRASFLRYLALGGCENCRPPVTGLGIRGAFIEGNGPESAATRGLDLTGCTLQGELALLECRFPDPVLMQGARVVSLFLDGSELHRGLSGDGLEAKVGVFVRNGCRVTGGLRLLGARIVGDLDCRGATFRAQQDAQGAASAALLAERSEVTGSLLLREGFEAWGEVRLHGARIGGDLDCSGGRFRAEKDAWGEPGAALVAEWAKVTGSILLRNGFAAGGLVWLLGARTGGDLDCSGGRFRAEKDARGEPGAALVAEWAKVTGSILLRGGFDAKGVVWLLGARAGGDLDCSGGTFQPEKDALGEPGPALVAERSNVTGSLFLRDGFESWGEVRLQGARIGGDLDCSGGTFRAEKDAQGNAGRALSFEGLRAEGAFLQYYGTSVEGVQVLTAAEVGTIVDVPEAWPPEGCLVLNRFRYGAIAGGAPVDANRRLRWLALQNPARWGEEFWPQPYEQLAKVLREMGHEDEAKTVLVEKERLLRRAEHERLTRLPQGSRGARLRAWARSLPWRVGHQLWTPLLAMVAYGHRPERALWPALVLVLVGWAVIDSAADAGLLLAVPPAAGAPVPVLVPLAYAFENFVPIVSMGQTAAFRPDMAERWGLGLQVFLWLHAAAGWLIGGVAAAGVLGLFQRR